MTVWELINRIKGTAAKREKILTWMLVNHICPLSVDEELDEGPQPSLYAMACRRCTVERTQAQECGGADCYERFLDMEVETDERQ